MTGRIVHQTFITEVLCDCCNKLYTSDSTETGGILFDTRAVCPACAPGWIENAKVYGETSHIKDRARDGETFYSFVQRLRGGKPGEVRVTAYGSAQDMLDAIFGKGDQRRAFVHGT